MDSQKQKFFIWSGVFDQYEEAQKESIGDGFAGSIWRKRSLAALNECKESVAMGERIPFLHTQRTSHLVPIVSILGEKKEKFRILDVGGGLGIALIDLNQSLKDANLNIDYVVYEIPEVCSEGRSSNNLQNISFIDKFHEKDNFDLIFSSSALQYVANWRDFLRTLTSFNSEYVYLVDLFCGNIPSFVTLQTYYDSKIPQWFLNVRELKDEMLKLGYEVKFEIPLYVSRLGINMIDMSNFPKKYQIQSTLNILFKRR